MIHTDLTLLVEPLRAAVLKALEQMRHDEKLREMRVDGIEVSETVRAVSTQMAYYSRGRMTVNDAIAMYKAAGLGPLSPEDARKPVTWTLDSKHLKGEAIDLVPMRDGRRWWGAPPEVWQRMGEIGEAHGLRWGGRWKNKDSPHYEI